MDGGRRRKAEDGGRGGGSGEKVGEKRKQARQAELVHRDTYLKWRHVIFLIDGNINHKSPLRSPMPTKKNKSNVDVVEMEMHIRVGTL